MMTAFGDIELAVESMQCGAFDFRTKPFDVSEMKSCIQKAIESRKTQSELESYRSSEKRRYTNQKMIGESEQINKITSLIQKVAKSPSTTVLIEGPSGTGKEIVARGIHYASERTDRRFIEVNCTAIPESLMESELFGHEKGSFTDAKRDHKGIFEQANGGTLFLDEIGDMPLAMQAKLLRVLQEKRFKRVGGNRDICVDVRVIASTNIDLSGAVTKGSFREDLYYRLKVVSIKMPPLNKRGHDILLIARHYLKRFSREFKKSFIDIASETESVLLSYAWPGNVRELKNMIERAVLLESGEKLMPHHLGLEGSGDEEQEAHDDQEQYSGNRDLFTNFRDNQAMADALTLKIDSLQMEDVEKALLKQALIQKNWNRNAVAKLVGINRTTLYSKIKKYGLEREQTE